MNFEAALRSGTRMLTEGSVFELLRRDLRISFDTQIAHGGLIYDDESREILAGVHRAYLRVAANARLPIVPFTDTWRASASRIDVSRFRGRAVNEDNVAFLREVASSLPVEAFVCGLTGPAGDAYLPGEAPRFEDALRYHEKQIRALSESGVDLLMAATLPAFEEARAIAAQMAATEVPWLLSFVVRRDGSLLDGTPLDTAICAIDDETNGAAAGYSINCVHPSVLAAAMRSLDIEAKKRVIAFQANTSSLPPEQLDGLDAIDAAEPESFAKELFEVADAAALSIVGGCCGTDVRHMTALAELMSNEVEVHG